VRRKEEEGSEVARESERRVVVFLALPALAAHMILHTILRMLHSHMVTDFWTDTHTHAHTYTNTGKVAIVTRKKRGVMMMKKGGCVVLLLLLLLHLPSIHPFIHTHQHTCTHTHAQISKI
jgi:hypothetical protein